MPKKKAKTVSWQRAVFLAACKELKPFADKWHVADEIDSMNVADVMKDIIARHGRSGYVAAIAVASAWAWLMTDEDIRSSVEDVSEYAVASDYYMPFWWLGGFHVRDRQKSPASKRKKRAAKKRLS